MLWLGPALWYCGLGPGSSRTPVIALEILYIAKEPEILAELGCRCNVLLALCSKIISKSQLIALHLTLKEEIIPKLNNLVRHLNHR